jgi:hypothetical protein
VGDGVGLRMDDGNAMGMGAGVVLRVGASVEVGKLKLLLESSQT